MCVCVWREWLRRDADKLKKERESERERRGWFAI